MLRRTHRHSTDKRLRMPALAPPAIRESRKRRNSALAAFHEAALRRYEERAARGLPLFEE